MHFKINILLKIILLPIRFVYCLYAFTIFMALMFVFFPLVIIASFFGKIKGGNFIYKLCYVWTDVWLFLIGIYHQKIIESPVDKSQQYIFISNHISYLDIPQMMKAVRQPKRILGKVEMIHIPVFGFIYKSAVVTVDRSSPEKRAKSVKTLKSVLNKGISIFLCPEGTFNMSKAPLKEFYDGAFRMAIETKTPIKPMLFLDTYDRMHYNTVFSLTPGPLRTVYLETIQVQHMDMKDLPKLKQKVFDTMEEALIRYKASWIK